MGEVAAGIFSVPSDPGRKRDSLSGWTFFWGTHSTAELHQNDWSSGPRASHQTNTEKGAAEPLVSGRQCILTLTTDTTCTGSFAHEVSRRGQLLRKSG